MLVKELYNRLYSVCKKDQSCWIKQSFVSRMEKAYQHYLKTKTYRPTGPSAGTKWLNTININKVLKQYEDKYPEFISLGAVPLDFYELESLTIPDTSISLKNLDIAEINKLGKIKIGMVINLDRHDQSGSHWVGLYADLELGVVYFYDSYGSSPPKEIRKFMRIINRYITDIKKIDTVVDHNKLRHQRKNSECGVYSMQFILRLLSAKNAKEEFIKVNTTRIPDDEINKCRDIYFRSEI